MCSSKWQQIFVSVSLKFASIDYWSIVLRSIQLKSNGEFDHLLWHIQLLYFELILVSFFTFFSFTFIFLLAAGRKSTSHFELYSMWSQHDKQSTIFVHCMHFHLSFSFSSHLLLQLSMWFWWPLEWFATDSLIRNTISHLFWRNFLFFSLRVRQFKSVNKSPNVILVQKLTSVLSDPNETSRRNHAIFDDDFYKRQTQSHGDKLRWTDVCRFRTTDVFQRSERTKNKRFLETHERRSKMNVPKQIECGRASVVSEICCCFAKKSTQKLNLMKSTNISRTRSRKIDCISNNCCTR